MRGALLGFVLVASAAACHHDAAPVAPVTNANPPMVAARHFGGDDLVYLPIDSAVVFGLDLKQLRTTELYKQVVEPHMGELTKSLRSAPHCAVELIDRVTSLSGGVRSDKGSEGVLVAHGVSHQQFAACLEKSKAQLQIVEKDGSFLITKDKDHSSITFLDGDVAVIALGSFAGADIADRMTRDGNKANLHGSPAFEQMMANVKRSDTLWFLAHDKSFGMNVSAIYGSLRAGNDLSGTVAMRTGSPTEASTMAQTLTGQAQQLMMFVTSLSFHAVGSDVIAEGSMDIPKLQSLLTMAGIGRSSPPPSLVPTP